MVEGRAYTHGTLRAAQRRSERAGMGDVAPASAWKEESLFALTRTEL